MSTGERMPIEKADRAAVYLMNKWGMTAEGGCSVVGSVRRRRDMVGDLEFIAPASSHQMTDTLFEAIDATCQPEGVFATLAPGKSYLCEAVRGLKRGFLACSLTATLKGQTETWTMPVQIFRYTPENRGWITLMRTGPGELGKQVLIWWKKRFSIQGEASVEGHLVDSRGQIVPVPTEEDIFRKLQMTYIPPEDRDAFIASVLHAKNMNQREALR